MSTVSKKLAMVSQPMGGQSREEIASVRERAKAWLEAHGYEFVNTWFEAAWYSDDPMETRGIKNKPVAFLAKSLEKMAMCDLVYFCLGWHTSRGCRLEHEAADAYGLEIHYEAEDVHDHDHR